MDKKESFKKTEHEEQDKQKKLKSYSDKSKAARTALHFKESDATMIAGFQESSGRKRQGQIDSK